jgi:transposase
LPPPADAELRAERLRRDLERFKALERDVAHLEAQLTTLLESTDGQLLTTLPGTATVRAAALCLPRAADRALRDYSASGLAPASYESATIRRRGRISRQGLAERRDALMGIAWGLSQHSESFRARDRELRARGMQPIEAHVALARHACRLCFALLATQQPFDEQRYRHSRHSRGR